MYKMSSEWFRLPNLLSLSRVAMTPFLGYYLAGGDGRSTVICAGILLLAAATDGLDGYLARRTGQVTKLGIALDPIADKIFAGVLVVLLIFYREFPVWLAAAIVGRDLVILIAGLLLLRGREIVVPSNITGKYTFTVVAFLLGSHVIRFDFGIWLMTLLTVLLLILSTVIYARVFLKVRGGDAAPVFADKPLYKILRITTGLVVLVVFFFRLWRDLV